MHKGWCGSVIKKAILSVVDQQYDFYADVVHHQGQYCWVAWQAPFMPWDESSLYISHHTKGQWQTSCIKSGSSVVQPQSTPQGLVVMSDENGFYQPYVWRNRQWLCLQAHEADFVPPMWLVGYRHWCYVKQLWTLRSQKGQWELFADEVKIEQPLVEVYDCMPMNQRVVLIGASVYSDPMVIQVQSNDGYYDVKVLYEVMKDWPYRLECINHGGVSSWLWWPQKKTKVPLMVWVHSGPTSQVTPAFDAKKEAWLEQGYAVLAVNYTGSSGFGRIFRQALLGQWGVQDVHDVNELTTRVSQHPNIDEHRIYIRGSSAGGLTVLRLIQNSVLYKAAVVYYPVSQVDALSDTHRFERHYGDRLISAEDRNDVKPCLCPLLCFHGKQDRVVPLYQTEALVAELRALDCCVKLVVFDDEGHGFKSADNRNLAQKTAIEWCDTGGF